MILDILVFLEKLQLDLCESSIIGDSPYTGTSDLMLQIHT